MIDITLNNLIAMQLSIVEVEEYLPSIRVLTNIHIKYSTGFFKYQADDIWFNCVNWDQFTQGLIKLEKVISLEDMSEQFKITIQRKASNGYTFNLFCAKPNSGKDHTNFNFSTLLDSDGFSQVIRSFEDFPKWW